ncbi:MAG: hypothetical protein ACQKBT_05765 [Puniceicoccales bacterium]
MNCYPLLLGLTLLSAPAIHAQTIFDHTFDGNNSTDLNGTPEDYSGELWVDNGLHTDGTYRAQGSSVLPYDFGSGIYEITVSLDLSEAGSTSSGLGAIYFTTSDPLTPSYVNQPSGEPYSTFAIRGDSSFEFWAGLGTAGPNDGGTVHDYDPSFTDGSDAAQVGTLRLILDTTQAQWTATGFYAPETGSEFQVDLNAADSESLVYTYATNPSNFTGVGLNYSNSQAHFEHFTMTIIPEPSSSALIFGSIAILILGHRKVRS